LESDDSGFFPFFFRFENPDLKLQNPVLIRFFSGFVCLNRKKTGFKPDLNRKSRFSSDSEKSCHFDKIFSFPPLVETWPKNRFETGSKPDQFFGKGNETDNKWGPPSVPLPFFFFRLRPSPSAPFSRAAAAAFPLGSPFLARKLSSFRQGSIFLPATLLLL